MGDRVVMINKFNLNKKYVFDKDIAIMNDECLKRNYDSDHASNWVNYCHGKDVDILNQHHGSVENMYMVSPEWCKEVK